MFVVPPLGGMKLHAVPPKGGTTNFFLGYSRRRIRYTLLRKRISETASVVDRGRLQNPRNDHGCVHRSWHAARGFTLKAIGNGRSRVEAVGLSI